MKKALVIYGIGKFAEYAAYLFQNDTEYKLIGFCIEEEYFKKFKPEVPLGGYELLKFENLAEEVADKFDLFIAVGNNSIRERIFSAARKKGWSFANYISKKAVTWKNLEAGENVFVGEGSVIQPFVKIGDNSFIIGGRIGHHSLIGNHVLLSGSTIGGNSKVGDFSFLGLNSAVSQNVSVATANLIGMNVTIEKDTAPNAVYTHKGTVLRKIDSSKIFDRSLL